MDFQKAFDKVPHKRLVGKVKNYGLDNPLLGWIEDFLTGRTQRVSVKILVSEYKLFKRSNKAILFIALVQ
jgi:hypothetical protein